MSPRLKSVIGLALEIAVPLAILVGWQLWSAGAHSFFFPPLLKILKTFKDTWLFTHISPDFVPSLVRVLIGFSVAVLVGVTVGLPLGMWSAARRATSPIVEFLRAIPPPALIPFGIIVIGTGNAMKIFVIAFVSVWPVLLNTVAGVTALDSTLKDTVRVYAVPKRQEVLRVIIPAASPPMFAGMRTSLALAILMMVISEMEASTNGVGYFILQAERTFAIPEMWSGIIVLGLLGYILNLIFQTVERHLLRWHRGARASALS